MKLIAFEGPDCLGKTTQVERTKHVLQGAGISCSSYKIPWQNDFSYQLITELLQKEKVSCYPIAFQALMIENRKAFQKVLGTLEDEIVLVDRWNLSTLLYGEVQGIPRQLTAILLKDLFEPDLTFIFRGDPFPRGEQDELDKDLDLQTRLRFLYDEVRGENVIHLDANADREEITNQISSEIQNRFSS